jgi:large subunit ribosomal protein L23
MFEGIKSPIFTEKTVRLSEIYGQCVFAVDYNLTKPQIRKLLETMFSVSILQIRTHKPPGTKRRRGNSSRLIPKFKRAIVTLAKGEKIPFFSTSLFFTTYLYGFAFFSS